MTRVAALRALCLDATRAAGLTPVGECFHQFEPQGVTGTVLLAESHLAIHTWPEIGFVSIDVYVCNLSADNSGRAHQLYGALRTALAPVEVREHVLDRSTGPGRLEHSVDCAAGTQPPREHSVDCGSALQPRVRAAA